MITDAPSPAAFCARIPLRGMAGALAAWFGGTALLALAIDPDRLVVFGPAAATTIAIEHSGAWPVSNGAGFVVVLSHQSGVVRQLYAHGAWFVWPAVLGGCGS